MLAGWLRKRFHTLVPQNVFVLVISKRQKFWSDLENIAKSCLAAKLAPGLESQRTQLRKNQSLLEFFVEFIFNYDEKFKLLVVKKVSDTEQG